jgi:hypothetical protein
MKQELRDDLMDWKAVPVSQRPRRLSIFPRGLAYFKSWRSLRWFLLLLLPWLPNSIAAYLRGFGPFNSIGLFLVGAGLSIGLFVGLCSGMDSTNWGTFYRSTEPVRYWVVIAIGACFYLAFSVAGYFVR